MSKNGSHCSFGHLKHKLWPKEGPGVKLTNSQPKKVGNRPDLLVCRQRVTYRWKALDKSYNFALDCTSQSYGAPKSRKS
jgi:Uma2 family endonuclease